MSEGTRLLKWLLSDDTGISSEAIAAKMNGLEPPRQWGSHPHDTGDFGRCHRLLVIMPEYSDRLDEMRELSPEWAALVEDWDDITRLYLHDEINHTSKCYDRMKNILNHIENSNAVKLNDNVTVYFSTHAQQENENE